MSRYAEFFLASRADVVQLDLIEISHPDFSQVYRIVRNAVDGVTVNLGPGEEAAFFQWYPIGLSAIGATDDMDAALRIEFADLGEVIPEELDRIDEAGGWLIKPAVRYWSFRSDDLTAPLIGPLELEIGEMGGNDTGTGFEARAPQINASRTGERYTLDRFPMLRGAL